ncbi:MAG: exodeoxyribonuclease I, partial [Rubrivivax sp.]
KGHTLAGMWAEIFNRAKPEQAPDVDEDLYGGFVSREDRQLLDRLRALSPDQLAQRVGERPPAFEDDRLDELLFRYRARNFPGTLNTADQERWLQYRAARLHQGQGGALSLPVFFERIDALGEPLAETDDERGQAILGALYDYAEQIAP